MFSTSEATKKLFKAIEFQNASGERIKPEEAWNHFQQALKEGANVNAFEDGMTPLMCIASAFVTSNNEEHQYLELMAKLLVEHKKIDLNIKSKQAVIKKKPKEHDGYPVYEFEGREVVDKGIRGCVYLDNLQPVNEGFIPQNYARAEEEIKTGKKEKNTALHIACKLGNVNMIEILLTHPNIKPNIKNYENKSPRNCIAEHVKEIIEPEFIKVEEVAQKRKQINYACAFLLSGVLAAGICFAVDNSTPLVATSLLFLAIGCGYLYRVNTVINDVSFSQVIVNERASDVSVQVRYHSST
ncbi:ankyrin repeat domain-containing protein [Wolbachia endosymbiont of Ostrinia scapulalis]|uniref:ankyrin repeat domain-containing protein n=1 Tax=Wolbachia endosymbiont of Ostrinia scapulalis TaxID=183754 RepID=UPI0020225D7C|nr:ankyrin repeat domain-containing protein [Wolbachia endosymbiont of Ostrinia scapulalis]URG40591.1 ankyrin repeat domain-containing protein [Wolbachia endosymbiont of Ostrinia scapulalis]